MNIYDKDVYEYLVGFADDKTVLNMLSVNKKFSDPAFFEKIIEKIVKRRYPLLISFKEENESWKNFYIRMVYYISKLQENYEFPYIPAKTFNPQKFYKEIAEKRPDKIWHVGIQYAAMSGRKDLYDYIIQKIGNLVQYKILAMNFAARAGHLSLIKYILQDIGDATINLNGVMAWAAKEGHIDIVKFAMEKGADDYNWSLGEAASSGHLDIVKLMIEQGATDYEWALNEAEKNKDLQMVDYIKQFLL